MQLRPLQKDAKVGIAAPAAPFSQGRFLRAVRNLRGLGLRVDFRKDIVSQHRYLAGSDQRRSQELQRWLADPKIAALLFARGGYGTQRLLPKLQKVFPKIVVGFSDLTVLLVWLWQRHQLPSLYGPMLTSHLVDKRYAKKVVRMLQDPAKLRQQRLIAKKIIRPGRCRGRLVGGCLTLLASLLGTPDEIETNGTILFLEDTDEPPYAVDRLLTQLEQAGKFRKVRGIVLGSFRLKKTAFPSSIEKVFRDRLQHFSGPILWGIRFGHCPKPHLIPYGGMGRITGRRLILERAL